MPQLNPFSYVNTTIFGFIVFVISLYIFSKYILPNILRLFLSRQYITWINK
jgi:F-type H+-transporting ATPase subunit 8